MRIAIVGGDDVSGDHLQQLCAALAVLGHEPIACYPTAPAAQASGGLPHVGEWAARLEDEWASESPDVVHAYGWLGGLAAQLAARRRRLPTVQSFLGLAASARPRAEGGSKPVAERERLEPLLARGATWATGECAADVDVLARLRRSRARVSALTSGVDVQRYTPVGPALARTDLHRILGLAPNPLLHNGFDTVIRALPRVPDAELLLAETDVSGREPGDARKRLGCLATELGVADRVRFVGTVADDELPVLVRSADVVVCTPRRPPRATTVLQAMASGVVVVASSVGVLKDAVVDNVTGILVPPESRAELAAALRGLLSQAFQRESMGAAGRSRAVSRFAWGRIALDSVNIYGKVGAVRASTPELQPAVAR
ncbi:glycosyltransferase [Mycobacterium parmense]|uniref:Glycosyl transferase n=1 Tax=Mycobacterium parmense TaxID=185642 RepID=A0A7I7YTZ2_9MYCO|nr:glycosyltransferase [Mycobacterium parmense]MCV7351211.1 glycosyltransferase [Mycobacterium parmense]ORW60752.1 glycosyl transferase family 1 [Mycobacterium parmense]BBZ45338.1 glycosyl transferase [Mycobacterium parmense]